MSKTSEMPSEEAVQQGQVTAVEDAFDEEAEDYPLTKIGKLAADMGVSDLSTRHREYAHGLSELNSRES